MGDITQKIKKMMESGEKRKLIYQQSGVKSVKLFVDDLSVK